MKLYITGNGFDLHHGLDTSYISFGYFLRSHQRDSYDNLVEFLGFSDLPSDRELLNRKKHALWCEFESNLAELNTQEVLDAFTDYLPQLNSPDFRDGEWHSFDIEMQRVLENITDALFNQFDSFISQIKFPELTNDKKLKISNNALFINFNYTNTIERYYGIHKNQILYIHGDASIPGDRLIIGHGVVPENFEEHPEEPPTDATEEDIEQWEQYMSDKYDYAYESGKQTLNKYFTYSFKNTEEIILKSQDFFYQLSKINEVIIIGHSLSKIDLPYFEKIKKHVQPDSTWTATWYLDKEYESHLAVLKCLGIENPTIVPIGNLLMRSDLS
ncbi:bacteriophage abortive infection AbiH family protein [Pantoea ananatis]|uniref:bacteriophage abortive infection AbiH family protein n=1 Tax=Pantoea ananas TaxID=553 RepID=UPI003CEC2359